MLLKSEKMELRGISQKTSTKTNKPYKMANMESVSTGEHLEIYLGDGSKFASLVNGKKGDLYSLTFKYEYKELKLYTADRWS